MAGIKGGFGFKYNAFILFGGGKFIHIFCVFQRHAPCNTDTNPYIRIEFQLRCQHTTLFLSPFAHSNPLKGANSFPPLGKSPEMGPSIFWSETTKCPLVTHGFKNCVILINTVQFHNIVPIPLKAQAASGWCPSNGGRSMQILHFLVLLISSCPQWLDF